MPGESEMVPRLEVVFAVIQLKRNPKKGLFPGLRRGLWSGNDNRTRL